jgi:hypothetical protein
MEVMYTLCLVTGQLNMMTASAIVLNEYASKVLEGID